jgi:hypothetical protein
MLQLRRREAFGTEIVIGERQRRADAELPIQLVQRRSAEAPADVSPDVESIGEVIASRGARTGDRVASIGSDGTIVDWRTDQAGFEVVALVIPPAIDTRAQCQHELRSRA